MTMTRNMNYRSIRFTLFTCAVMAALFAIGSTASLMAGGDEDPPATKKAEGDKPADAPKSESPEPATGDKTKEAAADDAQSSGDPEPKREPSYSEILKELQRQSRKESKTVVKSGVPGKTAKAVELPPGNAVAPPQDKLLPDGSRLVDRPGRLTRDGDRFVFSFESRGQGATERPMQLLPNRLLEDMEMYSENGLKPIVFVISGEITEYHGVNYLLIQKLLVRPDTGNLR